MCGRDWDAYYGSRMNLCTQEKMGFVSEPAVIEANSDKEEE